MGYCFGIDIGGTTVKIGLAAEDGTLLEGWEIPTRREPTPEGLLLDIRVSILDRLDRELDRGKKQKIRRADILGIGMAAPGAVTADGILHGAVNIGWGDVALAEEAERIIGISPVCVGNDARLAALGEAAYGAGVGARSMLMVTLGTGVGGGVVLNGKVLMGESGVAGEIGHMTVNPFETVRCNCGKMGCLEQYASATGMVRVAKQVLAKRMRRGQAMCLPMRLRMRFRRIWGWRLPMRCILWIRRKSYLAAAFLRRGSCFCKR